ncbi:MAG: hypothetical protein RQ729_02245 [Wenzhouxiangellaceae bacterium]|nr:hypothetical protein [Wenzhouxiangellaceae bacterium]
MNASHPASSREVRDAIIGKCITGVVSRAGRHGEPPVVMMLQFDDGSAIEFVSPRGERTLRKAVAQTRRRPSVMPAQLALAMG